MERFLFAVLVDRLLVVVMKDGIYLGCVMDMEDGECLGVAGDGEDFCIGGVANDDLGVVAAIDLTGEDNVGGSLYYSFNKVGDGEVGAECLPGAVGGGFEEGDVEGEGVIDGEVVDVAGGYAVGIVVAAVEVADVALGEEVAPGGDGGDTEEGEEEEGENPLFHRLAIITFTREQASSAQHWRLPLT